MYRIQPGCWSRTRWCLICPHTFEASGAARQQYSMSMPSMQHLSCPVRNRCKTCRFEELSVAVAFTWVSTIINQTIRTCHFRIVSVWCVRFVVEKLCQLWNEFVLGAVHLLHCGCQDLTRPLTRHRPLHEKLLCL